MHTDAIKMEAIELLATTNMDYKDIAKKLNIDYTTLYRWRRDPEFAQCVQNRVNEHLKDIYPYLINACLSKIKNDRRAFPYIKLLFERIDRIDDDARRANEDLEQTLTFTWRRD